MNLYSRENIDFLLQDVFEIEKLFNHPLFNHHSRESVKMVIDSMHAIAEESLLKYFKSADKELPIIVEGNTKVHHGIHQFVKAYKESGLQAATFPLEWDGMQLPKTVYAAIELIGFCANNSFMMYTDVVYGVSNLIQTFGTEEQKKIFIPQLVAGDWYGTMCLTEPQAGSSLSDVKTIAVPQPDGTYKISGQKIFISAGDHDLGDNIIHMVLARTLYAPIGTKGISLFIVPKYKLNTPHESNDVQSVSMYHKMGQKATPAMHLSFGDHANCTGYLLGKENEGLLQMFQMMNGARLAVGLSGISIASAAYYYSLYYAQERKQGRRPQQNTEASEPIPIIQHADIRRMLFSQKAIVEGGLALLFQCYHYMDLLKTDPTNEKYGLLLELLTPIAKTFGAEYGQASVNQAFQIFGGYGYTEDFPLEQLYRDVRIMSIYEGTTGIQAIAVLGRQIPYKGGIALKYLIEEIEKTLSIPNQYTDLKLYARELEKSVSELKSMISSLNGILAEKGKEEYLSRATLFVEYISLICVGWQWVRMGQIAQCKMESGSSNNFYFSKLKTLDHFYKFEYVKTEFLYRQLMNQDASLLHNEQREILI